MRALAFVFERCYKDCNVSLPITNRYMVMSPLSSVRADMFGRSYGGQVSNRVD